jgi:hypothetical protein
MKDASPAAILGCQVQGEHATRCCVRNSAKDSADSGVKGGVECKKEARCGPGFFTSLGGVLTIALPKLELCSCSNDAKGHIHIAVELGIREVWISGKVEIGAA